MRRLNATRGEARITARAPGRRPGAETPARRRAEQGVALLVVLSTLALVGSVVADFQFNARVDLQLALNARDEVQAEYNALSALRLRAQLLKNARGLNEMLGSLGSVIGIPGEVMPPAGQLLEMIPVECSLLSAITRHAGGGLEEAAAGDAEAFFPGDCRATSVSEHAKISLPAMRIMANNEAQAAAKLLMGFLSSPQLQRFFEHDDAAGSHAESPLELIGAVIDWIDIDRTQAGNQLGDEDRFYEYLRDPYSAKNAPFDSVAELQLVHGFSDELYDRLKDQVTVYVSTAQVELATADVRTILIALMPLARTQDLQTLNSLLLLGNKLLEMRSFGTFLPMTVANLKVVIDTLGLPIDTARLNEVFSDRSSTIWYTIDAEGELGNARKRIRAVLQTQEGQYYYYRIE